MSAVYETIEAAQAEKASINARMDEADRLMANLINQDDRSAAEDKVLASLSERADELRESLSVCNAYIKSKQVLAETLDDPANAEMPHQLLRKYFESEDNNFGALTSKQIDAFVAPAEGDKPAGFNWSTLVLRNHPAHIKSQLAGVGGSSVKPDVYMMLADLNNRLNAASGLPAAPPDGIIPVDTYPNIYERLAAFGGPLQSSTIFQTSTGNKLKIPVQDTTTRKATVLGSRTGQSVATAVVPPVAWPEFQNVDFDSHLYRTTSPIAVTRELVRDAVFDLVSFLEQHLVREGWRGINEDLTVGDGNGKPDGMALAANTKLGRQSASGNTNRRFSKTDSDLIQEIAAMLIGPDDAYIMGMEGVNGLRRAGSGQVGWQMHRSVYRQIWATLKLTRAPLAQTMPGSQIKSIDDEPVFIAPAMTGVRADGTSANAGDVLALYGWLGANWVRIINDERVRIYTDSPYDANNAIGAVWFGSVDAHYVGGVGTDDGATDAVVHFITQ